MINLNEVGATPRRDAAGNWQVTFGIYLPGITYNKGYRLKVRVIHEQDQFIRGTLELMPVTSVKEDVEWGYTPLSYLLAR